MPSSSTIRWTILLLSIYLAGCEEWYVPNSRMISDVEFAQKIQNDQTTFKLVKFFIPNCVYCRYLKGVIDDLKAEKKWQFEIYDFNCAWYPALCNRLQIGSYPFTGIFNAKGQLDDQIGGFYPYPVMKQYFQQIEKMSLEFKQSTNSLSTHEQEKPSLSTEAGINQDQPKEQENKIPVVVKEQQPPKTQDIKQKEAQVQKVVSSQSHIQHNSNNTHLSGVYHHIFYCICILLGVVYFSSFANKDKFGNESHQSAPNNPETVKNTNFKIAHDTNEGIV